MTKIGRFSGAVAAVSDMSQGTLPGQSLVEICGDSRVLIEHHRGIAQYGSCEIRVRVKMGSVLVCGTNLSVLLMTKEKLVIGGVIENVRICRGG